MDTEHFREIRENEIVRKCLAKWMAQFCFRNTKLEELHNRISDEEMKTLMIDCVNHCYAFLSIMFATDGSNKVIEILKQEDQLPQWNEPEMPAELIDAATRLPDILKHLRRETAS